MPTAPSEANGRTTVVDMIGVASPLPAAVEDVCTDPTGSICSWVYDITDGNETTARIVTWAVDVPARVLLVLVVAWVANKILKRSVRRIVTHIVAPDTEGAIARLEKLRVPGASLLDDGEEEDENEAARRTARAVSISNVLESTVSVAVWSVAVITALGTTGIELGPLIAGAGIAGVAIGFGAQSLVQDCIAGLFMLLEDQYGIGDVVDLGEAVGTVEEITLRSTVLRSLNGTVWHVPNGQVQRVGNLSQLWSVALVDVDVAYDTDLTAARQLFEQAATEVCNRPEFVDDVLEPPTVLGVETLGADGISIRLMVKVDPGTQWALQRAIREHVKTVFDGAGVEIPFPQRTVWVRHDGDAGVE